MSRRPVRATALAVLLLGVAWPGGAGALRARQDSNIQLPVETIEDMLRHDALELQSMRGARFEGDRTSAMVVRFADSTMMQLKWAPAPRGGEEFNNYPRYEIAAYELQKLFLEPDEYVVPPTVGRCFGLERGLAMDPAVRPAYDDPPIVLAVLQYWLWNVEVAEQIDDADRIAADTLYTRHVGNLNLLTYLIRHEDSNVGNFLRSTDPTNPRVFSVDNGLAFRPHPSDRGNYWRHLRVDRYPARTVERLRRIELDDLDAALGVVAQCERGEDGAFRAAEPTANLNPDEGVRRTADVLQLGLTASEIRDIHARLERFIERVDDGHYTVF
ncbi:MAG: hypothetical protein ACRELC_10835 [Gemmatimonadota bacterium]